MNFESIKNEKPTLAVSEIKPIEESRNIVLEGRDSISKYVESPLVSACQIFWDKNIQTLSSSCNEKDVAIGYGHIIVDFDSMSPENQSIASSIGTPVEYDGRLALEIKFPINKETTTEEIERMTEDVANKFVNQQPLWVPRYTVDYIKSAFGIPEEESINPSEFSDEESGFYWDEETQLFYPSKELCMKVKIGQSE